MRRALSWLLDNWKLIAAVALYVVVVLIWMAMSGCSRYVPVKPTPPLVTPCIAEATAVVPDEPRSPKAGAPITGEYVVALKVWANELLGVITADRIAWRGERRCIRGLAEQQQIR